MSFRQTSDKAAEGAESSEILTVGLLKDEGFDELGDFVLLAPGLGTLSGVMTPQR